MNWHKITTTGAGVATASALLASAGHSFVQLNTPEAGVLTSAGASGILLPGLLSVPLGWLVSWVTHFLLSTGLPKPPAKPVVEAGTQAADPAAASEKQFLVDACHAAVSRLGLIGDYTSIKVVESAEKIFAEQLK